MEDKNVYSGGVQGDSSAGFNSPRATVMRGIFDPVSLLRSVLHRWVLVLLTVVLGLLISMFYIQQATPIFYAEAQLEMSVRRPKVINNDAVFDDSNDDTDMIFNTRFAKFRSPAMERLATKEYFKQYPEDMAKGDGGGIHTYMLASYIRKVDWDKSSRANIVYVGYENPDARFASRLVNVLTHCAGLLMMQENQAISDEAVKWLITQAEEQRDSLEAVEQQVVSVREELKLDSLEQQKNALGQALTLAFGEREALISKLASRRTVYDFIIDLQDADPNLEMLPTGLPKEERLDELIQTWRTANEELQFIAGRYAKIHPEYKQAEQKEQRAQVRLEQFIELSARSVLNEIELLTKQVEQVENRITAMKTEALALEQSLTSGMQKVQRVERKRDAADNAYQTMLKRMEEARLSADEDMAYTKVIRNAEVPWKPISPVPSEALGMGAVLGALIGCLVAIVMELFRDRISLVGDLKDLGVNVLNSIPTQKKVNARAELATIGLRDRFNHLVEIFAEINALLSSPRYVDKTHVILVSSIMPGEGKTVSSCNIAIASAFNGAKTLLIDGDLRRPKLANIFSTAEDRKSLLEWLAEKENTMDFEDLVSDNIIENLDLITSRPAKNINPAELLGRDRLPHLLKWARNHYDRIIIDSPPLGPVGDAQTIANLSDSVIIVSRLGKTRRRALRFALSRFEETGVPVLGCIANDVSHSLAGMFSGGDEGYGYSNGYGEYKPYGSE